MDYGVIVAARGAFGSRAAISTVAQRAEALGYAYLGVTDHIVQPRTIASRYPYNEAGRYAGTGEHMEQLALLSFLAAVTEKSRLLTSIMVVPHRPAILAAKMLATVDVLSGGRVTLGVGTGWMREEFEALGAPDFDTRGRSTDDTIRRFRALWAGEDKDVIFAPRPAQGAIPIWIGGESDPALRRAARLGDGWYPMGINPSFPLDSLARYRARVAELRTLTEKAGRDPKSVVLAYWASWWPAPEARASDGQRKLFTGADKDVAADVAALAELGASAVVVGHASASVSEHVAKMERFRTEVADRV